MGVYLRVYPYFSWRGFNSARDPTSRSKSGRRTAIALSVLFGENAEA